jgi:hypothetical protein
MQQPMPHIHGAGCPQCAKELHVHDTESFIKKATEVHKGKYDYSKSIYTNSASKMIIICPEHGEFLQSSNRHIAGNGCPECGRKRQGKGSHKVMPRYKRFEDKAHKMYNNYYTYDCTQYVNTRTKINITCPIHGIFCMSPAIHLSGSGCPLCEKEGDGLHILPVKINAQNRFIEKAKKIHNNKYDYSKTEYISNSSKIEIICPNHGSFMQRPDDHLRGCGCPYCNNSKGENQVKRILSEQGIEFIEQATFPDCKDKHLLRFDFYIPKHNIFIEYNGEQHYRYCSTFHKTEEDFEDSKRRDAIKKNYAEQHGIFIEIPYTEKHIRRNLINELISAGAI